jgi:hypothetical protein
MKKLFVILFFLQITITLFGQEELVPDYILFENKDTIFCVITRLERGGGNVYSMIYIDENNQSHTIKKKEVPTIKSFRIGGYVNDYLPLKASKPDKYHRHIELKIDGKIKIYDHIRLIASTDSETGERKFYRVVGAGEKIYTIKLDNGGYYDINNKNLTDYIIPYMKNCQEFMKTNTERITVDNIEKIVGIYNESCKEE